MTEKKNMKKLIKGLIPTGTSGVVGLIIIAIVAFSLGSFFTGGSSSPGEEADLNNHSEAASSEPTIWTCSMHPQIKLPKPGKCPICGMDLIPLESGGAGELGPREIKLSETARQIARIETTPVRRSTAEAEIRMVGKLDYNETKVSYITAWYPGRIDKLFVNFTGTTVKKGEQMAYIYSPEMIAAQEELLQAKKAVKTITDGSSILKSTAQATLAAARDKLRLYGLSDDQINEIESLREIPDHISILAPAGGVVVDKHVNEGMYVQTGMRLYTIADLSELWAFFDAYESDLPWIKLNQDVKFTSLSFPGEIFRAKIDFIDPILDPKTRTVKVRAVVDNSDGRLKPDMFISGVLKSRLNLSGKVAAGNSYESPLLIPVTAPLITGTRAVVYVEKQNDDEGSIFEGREITLGPRAGNFYIVKSGLEEGDMVVTNGAFKIDAELQIQAKPSMMLPESGITPAGHDHGQQQREAGENSDKKNYTDGTAEYQFGASSRIDSCEEVQKALIPVYDAYFAVQMALADDDLDRSKEAFKRLSNSAKNVDMSLFKDDAHVRWMKIYNELINLSEEGSGSKDLENARKIFYSLSQAAIELHDTFGHASDQDFFLTYCPMANNNKGAYWLQTVDTVYNSFYGQTMLRCGEIKQKLARGSTNGD